MTFMNSLIMTMNAVSLRLRLDGMGPHPMLKMELKIEKEYNLAKLVTVIHIQDEDRNCSLCVSKLPFQSSAFMRDYVGLICDDCENDNRNT